MNKDFDEIYRLYVGDVYRFLLSLSASADMAEELTQETMFKAFKAIDSYNGACKMSVWLCQIAKNTYYDYCRKKKCEPLDENIADNASLEHSLDDKDMSRRLHAALHTLDEPYKEVFTLRVFGELSYKDIGDIFGKTDGWARIIYYRAKQRLCERLNGEHGE